MKRLILILSALMLIAGCADGKIAIKPTGNIDQDQGPICDRSEYAGSWICAQLRAHGIANAEDARDLILDANDVSLIMEFYTKEQLASALEKWDNILDGGGISYAMYLSGLVKDTEKAQRVSSILKRRFGYLLTDSTPIQSADIKILKLLNQRVRETSGI